MLAALMFRGRRVRMADSPTRMGRSPGRLGLVSSSKQVARPCLELGGARYSCKLKGVVLK